MTTFNILEKFSSKLIIRNVTIKEFLAEFLGTLILVFMGNCSVAQVVMGGPSKGDFFSINAGYGLAVFLGVLVSGGVSGGHLNPAVSLSMALFGKFPWAKVPIFMIAQYCGAFFGALLVFLVYRNALDTFDPERGLASAGIFSTFPGAVVNSTGMMEENFLHSGNGMADQVVGTAILLVAVCAIGDPRNMEITKGQVPALVGLVVTSIGVSLGLNCGYAINPARDLGPRLFTLVGGWGALPFNATTTDGVQWWWIPIVGPHLGGIIGVGLYTLIIELHHGKENDDNDNDLEMARKQQQEPGIVSVRSVSTKGRGRNGVCSTGEMDAHGRMQQKF